MEIQTFAESVVPKEIVRGRRDALVLQGLAPEDVVGYYTPREGGEIRTWFALPDGSGHGCTHKGWFLNACPACREADERIDACKVWGPHRHFVDSSGRWVVSDRLGYTRLEREVVVPE